MAKPIQDSISIVTEARKKVNELFKDSGLINSLPEMNGLFDRMLTRLKFMGGTLEPKSVEEPTGPDPFPPITNFMGEDIRRPENKIAADLNPAAAEKQLYLDKVQNLYSKLPTMNPESILKSYVIPEDILVLRGVAKRAGVANYETAELNTEFIGAIVKGIAKKAATKSMQQKIDEDAQKQKEKAAAKKEPATKKADPKVKVSEPSTTTTD